MTKYYAGYIGEKILKNHSTEKAFFLDYDLNGFGKTKPVWIPKSICRFAAPNECGNIKVYIPEWFFKKQECGFDYERLTTVLWCGNGEERFVEM